MSIISNAAVSYNFKNNNNFSGSGSLESIPFDTESGGFSVAWANYVASSTVPSGSSVSYSYRAGSTVAACTGAVYSSNINGLSGRYIQIKATYTKDDTLGVSTGLPLISDVAPYAAPVGKAIMIEQAATNKVLQSQTLATSWSTVACSVVSNVGIAPDGTATADAIKEDASASAQHRLDQSVTITANAKCTLSMYVKANYYGRGVYARLRENGGASSYIYFLFNPKTGSITSVNGGGGGTVIHSGSKYIGNGWYRVWVNGTLATGVTGAIVSINTYSVESGTETYTGDGVSSLEVWGVQLEETNLMTSYIPTTTVPVARNTEQLTIPSGAVSHLTSSGSIISRAYWGYKQINASTVVSVSYLFGHSNGSFNSNVFALTRQQSSLAVFSKNSGGSTTSPALSSPSLTEGWHTFGVTWSSSEISLWVDGTEVASVTGTVYLPSAVDQPFYIGSLNATYEWSDLIDDFVVYNEVLTDTEMASYTASGNVNIPLDHRTTYALRFNDNLLHGEGGYRKIPSVALDQLVTATNSTISWTETENASATGAVNIVGNYNVTLTGTNSASKSSGTDVTWDAGFFCKEVFNSANNFYVQWTTAESNKGKMLGVNAGLTQGKQGVSYNEIDFALYANSAGSLEIYENGTFKGSVGSYVANDVLRIDVKNSVVTYYKNGTLLYTSLTAATSNTNYHIVGALYSSSATLNTIVFGYYSRVDLDTSIDNGSTWSAATSGSAITGLSSEVTAVGKTFQVRQKLSTPRAATNVTLDDMTVKIAQKQTRDYSEYIKPLWGALTLTPTNLTKFQLENKKYSTSYYAGTRNNDSLTLAAGIASGVINGSSGAVIVRYYDDADTTSLRNRILFSCAKGSHSSGAIYLYQILGGTNNQRCYVSSDSATLYSAVNNNVLSAGWHTIGMRWSTSNVSMWIDGAFAGSGAVSASPTIGSGHIITIGNGYSASNSMSSQISQVDIFSETLTDAEMIAYTAATGAVIPVGIKHSYQMKFENSLVYGTCGKFTSRWQDAGSNCAGTPWVTYSKVDSTPGTTSVVYQFKASDDQNDSDSWTTDITSITGRYLKVRFNLISEDVDANTPTITSFRAYPEYS